MKSLWFLAIAVALTPAHAGEEEKRSCDDINGFTVCEVHEPPPDVIIKILPALTDEPSHRFFSAEI